MANELKRHLTHLNLNLTLSLKAILSVEQEISYLCNTIAEYEAETDKKEVFGLMEEDYKRIIERKKAQRYILSIKWKYLKDKIDFIKDEIDKTERQIKERKKKKLEVVK